MWWHEHILPIAGPFFRVSLLLAWTSFRTNCTAACEMRYLTLTWGHMYEQVSVPICFHKMVFTVITMRSSIYKKTYLLSRKSQGKRRLCKYLLHGISHWCWDKMASILQRTILKALRWVKMYLLKSNLLQFVHKAPNGNDTPMNSIHYRNGRGWGRDLSRYPSNQWEMPYLHNVISYIGKRASLY